MKRPMPRDERGSITIWLAIASFAMMVLVGLAVDLGGQVHAQQRAHDIAAQAARTGGQQVQAATRHRGPLRQRQHRRRPGGRRTLSRGRRRDRQRSPSPAATPSPST